MSKNKKVTIGENFCFSFKSGNIGTKKNARQYYDSHKNAIENWWVQTSRVPIFIDTNFLLNAYSMPKSQRTLFVNFIQSNKDRIYITDQIDEEYQRKRLNFIKNYSTSLQTISKELGSIKKASDITKHCEELLVKLENLKKRPIVQNDFNNYLDNIENVINRIKEWKLATELPCSALYKDVNAHLINFHSQLESEQKNNILNDDDIVNAVALCQFCGNISLTEKQFMYDLYQSCVNEREEMKLRPDNINLQMYTFPGLGDLSKKSEHKQREGDFLHYHEMLKQISELRQDVIFLTYDVKKGDNSTENLEPFDHYICNCFYLTGQVYYLVDANSLPLATLQCPDIDIDSDDEDEVGGDMTNGNVLSGIATSEKANAVQKRGCFKELTEDIFLDELSTCVNWANEYGDKYVSKGYFIYGILGHKRYEFAKIREMLDKLIYEGRLQIKKNEEGKDCLSIITQERDNNIF